RSVSRPTGRNRAAGLRRALAPGFALKVAEAGCGAPRGRRPIRRASSTRHNFREVACRARLRRVPSMTKKPKPPPPRGVIVCGSLAGLAGAGGLVGRGLEITLLESRPRLGGRASSFTDPATGELVDNCQHVSMGCCTNLADFCRRVGIDPM